MCVRTNGRPDLRRLLRRHGLTDPWRIGQAQHWCAVRYVLFDLLYHAGRCLLRKPLEQRREMLTEVCQRLDAPAVRFSESVVGVGTALYEAAVARGHEGVMAKHLASTYRPRRRWDGRGVSITRLTRSGREMSLGPGRGKSSGAATNALAN